MREGAPDRLGQLWTGETGAYVFLVVYSSIDHCDHMMLRFRSRKVHPSEESVCTVYVYETELAAPMSSWKRLA